MLFLWTIIQWSILLIISLLFITQLILPPFIDMPYFWLFRKCEKELLKAEDQLSVSKIDRITNVVKRKIAKNKK